MQGLFLSLPCRNLQSSYCRIIFFAGYFLDISNNLRYKYRYINNCAVYLQCKTDISIIKCLSDMTVTNHPSPLFFYCGEQSLLREKKTVFFSPFDTPSSSFSAIRQWMRTLVPGRDCVVCGNSTGIERFTLRVLLQRGFSVILPLATVIPDCVEELNIGWRLTDAQSADIINRALTERRLLMVASVQNVSVSTPTRHTLAIRNYWMRWVGHHFVLSSEGQQSYFQRLLRGKSVEVLS